MAESLELKVEAGIAQLTINRPEVFNAMNPEVIQGLARHSMALAMDTSVVGIVITGAGKAFSSGADLKEVARAPEGVPALIHRFAAALHQAVLEIRRMSKPVVAAVNGVAAGAGFSLALACDFRVLAKSAVLRQVYTSWGLCIDGGGTFMLPRLVGAARALEIATFDRPITAEQALEWGLATKVVEDGHAFDEAMALAREVSEKSLHSFGWSKRLITDSFSNPLEVHLEQERLGITTCVQHPDSREGLMAFLEKRKPVFNKDIR